MCKLILSEMGVQVKGDAPTECSYCGEEDVRLVVKPQAYAIDGAVMVNVNLTEDTNWICLECLIFDVENS